MLLIRDLNPQQPRYSENAKNSPNIRILEFRLLHSMSLTCVQKEWKYL